ncbi:MAG: hypothetical protein LHW44_05075 [Candidatus Cloacimonetes bacterium]|nr:hypothetical protein [Candidatus Cloacimonadota bacterium]
MQVDIKQLDPVTKEITLTVDAETANNDYQKYLAKSARDVQIQGFRMGKAPLPMVEKQYGPQISEYFIKDSIDEYFGKAAYEHELEYILTPYVMDVKWEKGSDFIAVIEIEHEPEVDATIPDPFKVPHIPMVLEEEVDNILVRLSQDRAYEEEVETAVADDIVMCDITVEAAENSEPVKGVLMAGDSMPMRSLPELVDKKVGDEFTANLMGNTIKLLSKNAFPDLDNDTEYPCKIMINSISRRTIPEIDDEFAKDAGYDDLATLKAEISDNLKAGVQHQNMDLENSAILRKLYADKPFELPKRSLEYMVQDALKKETDSRLRQFYEHQYRLQLRQYMINIYLENELTAILEPSLSDEDLQTYYEHLAILEDIPVEAWKEKHQELLGSDRIKYDATGWTMLRGLAAKAEFYIPEPEAVETQNQDESTESNTETTEE